MTRTLPTALVSLLLAAPCVSAQWYVGVQTGVTVGTLSGDFVPEASPALGATIGLDSEFWVTDRWVIDGGLVLVQRGAENLPLGSEIVDFTFKYLEVPITVGRTLPLFGKWDLSPYAGFAIAWMSNCGVRFLGEWGYMDCVDSTPGGEPTRVETSIPMGVAFRHRYPGGSRMSLELRYSMSLSKVLTPDDVSARNHVFQFLFAFVVPLSEEGP